MLTEKDPSAPLGINSLYFTFHLLLLTLFSLFAFSHNPGRLFIGNDGPMVLSLAQTQLAYFGVTLDLHSNPLQGIGNLSFPINLALMPGFWLPHFTGATFAPAAIYTFFAGLMFLTVLLVGWNYRIPRGIRYGAAWLLTILMFPYFGKYFAIYAVTASSPLFVSYMFIVAVADIGMKRMGAGSWRQSLFFAAILLLGIFMMLAASPAAIILMVPLLAASFAVSFALANRAEKIRKLVCALAVLILCIALGWVEYVAGLLLYSSSGFYMPELLASYSNAREFASILFQGHIADRAFGPVLFALAFIGAVWALYTKHPHLRHAAILTLVGQVLHAVIAAQLLAFSNGWTGPPPIYTEMTFFALYALFASFYVAALCSRWSRVAPALPVIVVALMSLFLLLRPAQKERQPWQSYAMPPAPNALVKLLHDAVGIAPDGPFGGRIASVLPMGINEQMRYHYHLNAAIGNDMQTSGLWFYGLPTLHEYNQLITPAFYRLARDFLTLPNDAQNRSWTNYSYIDTRLLAMLGVKYILSLDAQRDGLLTRGTLAPEDERPLYALEIPQANVAGTGATTLKNARHLSDALAQLKAAGFAPDVAVAIGTEGASYAPVTQSSIALEGGKWRIRAQSGGRSLLVVPIEYSHCMEVIVKAGNAPVPKRVNIALTGLEFSGQMDILLTTRIGPFTHPRCRMQDYREFKKSLREIP